METQNNFKEIIDKYPAIISEIDETALMAYANELSIPKAKDQLGKMNELISHVCYTQGISREALNSTSRGQYLVIARFVIWWCIRNQVFKNQISLSVIAQMFHKNHSTVAHGVNALDNLMFYDVELRNTVMRIANHFNRPAKWDNKTKILKVL